MIISHQHVSILRGGAPGKKYNDFRDTYTQHPIMTKINIYIYIYKYIYIYFPGYMTISFSTFVKLHAVFVRWPSTLRVGMLHDPHFIMWRGVGCGGGITWQHGTYGSIRIFYLKLLPPPFPGPPCLPPPKITWWGNWPRYLRPRSMYHLLDLSSRSSLSREMNGSTACPWVVYFFGGGVDSQKIEIIKLWGKHTLIDINTHTAQPTKRNYYDRGGQSR